MEILYEGWRLVYSSKLKLTSSMEFQQLWHCFATYIFLGQNIHFLCIGSSTIYD